MSNINSEIELDLNELPPLPPKLKRSNNVYISSQIIIEMKTKCTHTLAQLSEIITNAINATLAFKQNYGNPDMLAVNKFRVDCLKSVLQLKDIYEELCKYFSFFQENYVKHEELKKSKYAELPNLLFTLNNVYDETMELIIKFH